MRESNRSGPACCEREVEKEGCVLSGGGGVVQGVVVQSGAA